jgi:hypothetical protein
MPTTPTTAEVFDRLLQRDRSNLHVALPAVVDSYNTTTQTATVKPQLMHVLTVDEERTTYEYPSIPDVPVAWPRGGGYFLHFPLSLGDTGLLIFCERDLAQWRVSGENSDAGDDRLHTLAGAVFYPGLHTVPGQLSAGQAGTGEAVLAGGIVRLGDPTASDFAALASVVMTNLNAIKSAISGAAVVAGDGGAALKANIVAALSSFPAAVAATMVKIK